jgi:hypothetical protein
VRQIAPSRPQARTLYYQWGTSSCTSAHATEIYHGYVFTDRHNHQGGSSDTLCLAPGDPGVDNTYVGDILYATTINGGVDVHQGNVEDNKRIHCSACLAPASTCFKRDGAHTCPTGFYPVYTGYLYGSYYEHAAKMQRICIDHIDFDNSTDNSPNTAAHYYPTRTHSTDASGVTVGQHVACAICCGY